MAAGGGDAGRTDAVPLTVAWTERRKRLIGCLPRSLARLDAMARMTDFEGSCWTSRCATDTVFFVDQILLVDQSTDTWRERFPTVAEMSNDKLQAKGKKALEKDPRTHDWEVDTGA